MGLQDNPKLRGYQFVNPPKPMEVFHEKMSTVHELADGSIREYVKGFRIHATLMWEEGWVRNEDYSALHTIANDFSALTFVPRPNVPAGQTATFAVKWPNGPEFIYHMGHFNTWRGKIELIGESVTATASPVGL